MFQGRTEEALELYRSAFAGSKTAEAVHRGQDGSALAGKTQSATIVIGEQRIRMVDSDAEHAFSFTPSFSLFVDFDTEKELRKALLWLSEGGTTLMPLNDYGFGRMFAWVNDRFGVSWQLHLP